MPRDTPLALGLIRLACLGCGHGQTVTRIAWLRVSPRMACGGCRKIARWRMV
jgi:hypothetical protein